MWNQSLFSTFVPSPVWMLSLPHLGSNISCLPSMYQCGSLPHPTTSTPRIRVVPLCDFFSHPLGLSSSRGRSSVYVDAFFTLLRHQSCIGPLHAHTHMHTYAHLQPVLYICFTTLLLWFIFRFIFFFCLSPSLECNCHH